MTSRRPRESSPPPSRRLSAADVALFEAELVPRYLALFAEQLFDVLLVNAEARVCHVGCRIGYPDAEVCERLPGAHLFGCDPSEPAIARARARASGIVADYRVSEEWPTPFPDGAFSHVFSLHPALAPDEGALLMEELARLCAAGGQAVLVMPLRGSFPEIVDLLRECATKNNLAGLAAAVEKAALLRPTEEGLRTAFEKAGFSYVEVGVRARVLTFAGGRAFFEDAIAQLVVLPEVRQGLTAPEVDRALDYVQTAIDQYWSDAPFELTVRIGTVSGRKL